MTVVSFSDVIWGTNSTSSPSLVVVHTESVAMNYLKFVSQLPTVVNKEKWTYGNCLLVAFIFTLVGAGQMAASHSTVLYQWISFVAYSITHFIITAVLFEQKNRVLKMHFLNNWYLGFLLLTGSLSKFPLPDKSELVSSCSTSSTSVFQNYAMEVQDNLLI